MPSADPVHPHKTLAGAAASAATTVVAALLALPLWWLLTTFLQKLGALGHPLQPPDDSRWALWLGVSLLLLCWAPARRVWTGLGARFDSILLRPPTSFHVANPAASTDISTQLREWCLEGVGTGAVPLFLPNAIPVMPQPLSIAVWEQTAPAQRSAQQKELNAFMCQLDGTALLLACSGPWARRWLRLHIKLREALWWRARRESDPWDCGFLNTDPAALERLHGFLPRRPTLIVAQDVPHQYLHKSLTVLRERQGMFGQPMRLLVVGKFTTEEAVVVRQFDNLFSARPMPKPLPAPSPAECQTARTRFLESPEPRS